MRSLSRRGADPDQGGGNDGDKRAHAPSLYCERPRVDLGIGFPSDVSSELPLTAEGHVAAEEVRMRSMDDGVGAQPSEAELLEALGRELLGAGIGFGAEDPDRFRRFAERWIEQNAQRIRAALCDNPVIMRIYERDLHDRLVDAATVADALATLGGKPAVSLLAVILMHRGRERICGS